MRKTKTLLLPCVLLSLGVGACDSDDADATDVEPLSDYDALFEGAPTNADLPFELKADGPNPDEFFVGDQSPVRNQGRRGVCSIFSTLALMEHLYLKAGMENPDFSEQYLQWSSKFEVGAFPDTSGSNASYNLRAITDFGVPAEADWPYESTQWGTEEDAECDGENDQPTRCYTNGEPPQEAIDAQKYSLPRSRWVNTSAASIMDHMRTTETGVVVGLTFFYQAWNHGGSPLPINRENKQLGIVMYPNETDKERSLENRAGHSILLVGWDNTLEVDRRDENGDVMLDDQGNAMTETGFFIFKNSWGTSSAGSQHPTGAGYGYISMRYVDEYGTGRTADVPELEQPTPEDDGATSESGESGGDDTDGTAELFESDEQIAIPDNTPSGIQSVIEVDSQGDISDATVSVDIQHSWRGDLTVVLSHDGHSVTLHDRQGGGQEDLNLVVELDDFNGLDRTGEWSLAVVDNANADTGRLLGWSLEIR